MDGAVVTTVNLDQTVRKLRSVRDLASLTTYLHDELEWPIGDWDIEDLTFEYSPEEAGLDPKSAVKVRSIRRLRPITVNQPWGIFFIDFLPGDLPITVLRRILRTVVVKKRADSRPDRQTWRMDDLLFISVLGEEDRRDLNLAHFSEDPISHRATLRVVEWDEADTHFHLLRTSKELKKLTWPATSESIKDWRERWASAFALKPGEVPDTARKLASEMARLAKVIRGRVNDAMAVESGDGPLRRLVTAFREVLLHDLSSDGFADMYAQTLTYGLFTARRSRPMGIDAENARDMVPSTNPFLRDLLGQFTDVSGLTASLDFDELGIDALVEMLNRANIDAVVEDFGRSKPGEDPVIHFYEDFLSEYNRQQKIQRGIFYTPRPVVSYIIRSVHQLLQTEFRLEDGLASTDTWGDVRNRFPGLTLPAGAVADTPFVQILDPAVGTGTFLVEAIDVIYETMRNKWRNQGHLELEIPGLWNAYVPNHLLPRLYGFELMMAPYAIAHMKLGLKLSETGYQFLASERLRIYLTNTLEPPQDFSGQFDIMAPALAHEARAVNEVKRHTPFTVVIGNPPYAGISSNMTQHAASLVDAYKTIDGRALNERKLWLQDDYVKFIRAAQTKIEATSCGVLGYITNHSFLDNPTFRGMRHSLMGTFPRICVLDLHGNANRNAGSAGGSEDKNVFDIRQGVAITLASRLGEARAVQHAELWGTRETKYARLDTRSLQEIPWRAIVPDAPYFFFTPQNSDTRAEYDRGWRISDAMPVHSAGFITARDHFVIDFDSTSILERIEEFRDLRIPDAEIRSRYFSGRGSDKYADGDTRGWKLPDARKRVRNDRLWRERIQECSYRPFDRRFIYWADWMVDWPRPEVMGHMQAGPNLALHICRQSVSEQWGHALVARGLIDDSYVSNKTRERGYAHPLYAYPATNALAVASTRTPNFHQGFLQAMCGSLKLPADANGLPASTTPEDILGYIYSILHSPAYRSRYADSLKVDFPRVPLTADPKLFEALARFGTELVALHLSEAPAQQAIVARYDTTTQTWLYHLANGPHVPVALSFSGPEKPVVTRTEWFDGMVVIDAGNPHTGTVNVASPNKVGFRGVKEAVWGFHIGGYKVCEKWLKDRKGRVLTAEEIVQYYRVVIAIHETLRLMNEIDKSIEAHGGWPAAFGGSSPVAGSMEL